jgi:D-ribose pyranase
VKKTPLLNQPLSAAIAGLGHTDTLVIADAGLPIPDGPQRIDLAVRAGLPPLLDVLRAVLEELAIQEVVIAEEMAGHSPQLRAALREVLGDVPVRTLPHEDFKRQTRAARAIVRTGECTPYANIILVAGVVF